MGDVRLVFFDLETTGLDPAADRIVEIGMFSSDGDELVALVNPGVPIPAQATETHGITDADVKDAASFADMAERVEEMIEGAVLVGFNSLRFDVPFLDAELRRAGRKGLERDEWGAIVARDIDLYRVWVEKEKRSLADAAQRFADITLADGHRAGRDATVLRPIMMGMLADFFPLPTVEAGADGALRVKGELVPVAELQRLTAPSDMVDRGGKFKRREDGKIVFAFGQNVDKPVAQFPDYLRWMVSKDFADETKQIARCFLSKLTKQI